MYRRILANDECLRIASAQTVEVISPNVGYISWSSIYGISSLICAIRFQTSQAVSNDKQGTASR